MKNSRRRSLSNLCPQHAGENVVPHYCSVETKAILKYKMIATVTWTKITDAAF